MHDFGLDIEEMEKLIGLYISVGLENAKKTLPDIMKLPAPHRIFLMTQIELAEKAKAKLPTLQDNKRFIIPSRIPLEQASSPKTAAHKGTLVNSFFPDIKHYIDITGGMGGDFMAMLSCLTGKGARATYIERDQELFAISKRNIQLYSQELDIEIEYVNADSLEWLEKNRDKLNNKDTLIFADPARRGKDGGKLYKISDCQPDISKVQKLLPDAEFLFKLSPMLDINQALKELNNVNEIEVVELYGEVKELLIVCTSSGKSEVTISYNALDIEGSFYNYIFDSSKAEIPVADPSEGDILYIANPGLAKADAADRLATESGLYKTAPNTNIYHSRDFKEPLKPFFRAFRVVSIVPYKKSKKLKGGSYKIIRKNFPDKPEAIKKRLGVKEGGEDFLICYRRGDGKTEMAICERV